MPDVASQQPPPTPQPAVPFSVFLRSFLLEASWHAERMQGVGWFYAIRPVLRRPPEPDAVSRHTGYFNTNIAMAPTLLAAAASLELQSRGREAVETRDLLAAPLSGQADLFLWGALRPVVMGLGALLALWGAPEFGVPLAFLAWSVALLHLRLRGFQRGQQLAAELPTKIADVRPSKAWAARLHSTAALVGGVLLGWSVVHGGQASWWVSFHVGLAAVVGYYADKRGVSPGITFLVLVVLAGFARRLELSTIWLR